MDTPHRITDTSISGTSSSSSPSSSYASLSPSYSTASLPPEPSESVSSSTIDQSISDSLNNAGANPDGQCDLASLTRANRSELQDGDDLVDNQPRQIDDGIDLNNNSIIAPRKRRRVAHRSSAAAAAQSTESGASSAVDCLARDLDRFTLLNRSLLAVNYDRLAMRRMAEQIFIDLLKDGGQQEEKWRLLGLSMHARTSDAAQRAQFLADIDQWKIFPGNDVLINEFHGSVYCQFATLYTKDNFLAHVSEKSYCEKISPIDRSPIRCKVAGVADEIDAQQIVHVIADQYGLDRERHFSNAISSKTTGQQTKYVYFFISPDAYREIFDLGNASFLFDATHYNIRLNYSPPICPLCACILTRHDAACSGTKCLLCLSKEHAKSRCPYKNRPEMHRCGSCLTIDAGMAIGHHSKAIECGLVRAQIIESLFRTAIPDDVLNSTEKLDKLGTILLKK